MTGHNEKRERRVQILPEEVVNRIAAGEVVERPASVVKELVENSIDAESEKITVWVKDGGKSFIRIADDGIGMSEDDAILALERHATSKIRSSEDLNAISLLGFRGEALSSIAAVSLLEMRTGLKGETNGIAVRVEAGQIEEVKKIAWEIGTAITIRNIFYNTPGRRKFLRSGNTEVRHIVKIFKQFALGYPEKSFSLYHGDRPLWELAQSTLDQRIKEVFTESFFELLMELDVSVKGMNIKGYIAKPELVKSWSGEQYFYLNKRCILNRSLRNAVISAYGNTLGKGMFPFYTLSLEIDPEEVDVNVHPAKWEVRFRNEYDVRMAVYNAIRQRLSEGQIHPSSLTQETYFETPESFSAQRFVRRKFSPSAPSQPESQTESPLFEKDYPAQDKPRQNSFYSGVDPSKLWQVHNKYVICQVKTGVAIIDQHAAHERILYERTKEILQTKGGLSQHLIFPEIIELSNDDMLLVNEILPPLCKIGFSIKDFSNNTLVIDAVPSELRQGREKGFFRQFLDTYKEEDMRELDVYDRVASSFACHAAIRAGDPLAFEEMHALINELFATKFPYYCPHGRPIIIHITLEDLDKRFLR